MTGFGTCPNATSLALPWDAGRDRHGDKKREFKMGDSDIRSLFMISKEDSLPLVRFRHPYSAHYIYVYI